MNIAIVTDDSRVKLPKIDRYKEKVGRGVKLSEHELLQQVLIKIKIKIPSNDLENEKKYRSPLNEFIRPAKHMFSGMFSEVRVFFEELNKNHDGNLFIISGRYGIISKDEKIIPYDYHLENIDMIEKLDKKTNFFDKLIVEINNSDYTLLLVNKEMISYFKTKHLLNKVDPPSKLIVVTSNDFKNEITENAHIFLHRNGVARIGKSNREKIIEILEEN